MADRCRAVWFEPDPSCGPDILIGGAIHPVTCGHLLTDEGVCPDHDDDWYAAHFDSNAGGAS